MPLLDIRILDIHSEREKKPKQKKIASLGGRGGGETPGGPAARPSQLRQDDLGGGIGFRGLGFIGALGFWGLGV